MEKLKNNKGITLVMLVVTIIVLLILAGISISAITGGDSSMDKAKKAKDETAIKAEMEELQKIINQSAAKGIRHGNYSGLADSQTIRDALKKNKLIEENPDDVIIDGKNWWKVTGVKTGQKYKIRYDGEVTRIEELEPTKIYGKIADGVLYLRATEQTGYIEGTQWNDSTITKVIIEEPIAPSTCSNMFYNCSSLQEIENIENLHTENSNNMSGMFCRCNALETLDVTNFDTSNVEKMNYMFDSCKKLKKLDCNGFDTSKVTKMYGMFSECNELTLLNISNFNTHQVDDMKYMFLGCNKLQTVDVSKFNTSKVSDMQHMFNRCYELKNLNLTSFDTSNVNNMGCMFLSCRNLTKLDLSSFNTTKVENMSSMFQECNKLTTIYVSNNFNTGMVSNSTRMFLNNSNLKRRCRNNL